MKKRAEAALAVVRNVVSLPVAADRRETEELAFLPAALEIIETPPSPIGRAIGATIIVLFFIAMLWAAFAHVDIVASASGKVIPSGQVKLIQPFETGVVRAINVHDGQSVKAGDILIELDPTMTAAEEDHIKSDLISAQLDIARLHAALSDAEDSQTAFKPPPGASNDLIAMERQFLAKQTEEYRTKLASLDRQRVQKEAETEAVEATIKKLEATEPLIQQRVDIVKTLSDKGLGSKLTYLETAQTLAENQNEFNVQRSRLDEAKAALAAIIETRAHEAAEFRRGLFAELAEAERKAAGLSGDLVKAQERTKLQLLTAPVDGVVQQLAIHTVGGVVTPAQQLAVVVPSDSTLEIEAMVSNRDVGFVHVGQDAQIKVDAFNYTQYGLIHGNVSSVSRDAIVRDLPAGNGQEKSRGGEAETSEPAGQALNYVARVSLDRTQIEVGDAPASLAPGMAATVDIKTGSRSVLSYLLSPLIRYQHDALRER